MERMLIKMLPPELVNLTNMSVIEGDDYERFFAAQLSDASLKPEGYLLRPVDKKQLLDTIVEVLIAGKGD
jgi:hypothetical protein